MLHHSSANRYGDVYRIPFRLSTYNPESIEDTIVITDRLSEETYEIKVHILASNGTAGMFYIVVWLWCVLYSL